MLFGIFFSSWYWNGNALRRLSERSFLLGTVALHSGISLIVFSGCLQGFVYKSADLQENWFSV